MPGDTDCRQAGCPELAERREQQLEPGQPLEEQLEPGQPLEEQQVVDRLLVEQQAVRGRETRSLGRRSAPQ